MSNDSFLKMIGLEEKPEENSEELDFDSVEFERAAAEPDFDSPLDELVGDEQTETEYEQAFSDERTEKEEVQIESSHIHQPAFNDRTDIVTVEERPFQAEDLYGSDYDEEEESKTEVVWDEVSEQGQTAIYSSVENESLQNFIEEGLSDEDRLLDGLEEADASRATDIYASENRNSNRETSRRRTQAILGALEEESEVESEDFESAEPSIQHITATVDLDGSETDELEDSADQVSDNYSTGTLELDPEQYIFEDGSEDQANDKNNFLSSAAEDSRVQESSRNTVAFAYDDESDSAQGRIVVIEGNVNAQAFHLGSLPIRLGRDPANDVILDDGNASRFHAEIRDVGGMIHAVDLGSTNGIKVNGAVVTEKQLQDHDLVQVGDTLFEYLEPGSVSEGKKGIAGAQEAERTFSMPIGKKKGPATNRKKRIRVLAASIMLLAGAFLFYQKMGGIKQASVEMLSNQVAEDVLNFRNEIEEATGQDFSTSNPEEIKSLFLERINNYPLPKALKEKAANLQADILMVFMDEPVLIKEFLNGGATQNTLVRLLQDRLVKANTAGDKKLTLRYAELLLLILPANEELLSLKDRLKEDLNPIKMEVENISDQDKELFASYMRQHQQSAQKLIDQKEYSRARSFSVDVKDRIIDLVRKKPNFSSFAESALAEWQAKISFLDKRIAEENAVQAKLDTKVEAGNLAVARVRELMTDGLVYQAALSANQFFKDYPEHPAATQMEAYRDEIERVVKVSFEAMVARLDTHLKTESYKLAWEELYRFLDLVPEYRPALSQREKLLENTYMKARQYYNQARVFEFEADDLISAEQYYKRTLETADPRGELALKAERRYGEVRRKSIQ